jgi:hypothetical protein
LNEFSQILFRMIFFPAVMYVGDRDVLEMCRAFFCAVWFCGGFVKLEEENIDCLLNFKLIHRLLQSSDNFLN